LKKGIFFQELEIIMVGGKERQYLVVNEATSEE
jgi:hypothetical protein